MRGGADIGFSWALFKTIPMSRAKDRAIAANSSLWVMSQSWLPVGEMYRRELGMSCPRARAEERGTV